MKKKESTLTAIVVVQQLDENYWLSSDYKIPLEQAKNGNCRPLLELIIKKLKDNNIISKEAHIIKHDKDVIKIWNPDTLKYEIQKKEEHVHALLKFEKGSSLKRIALAIGVEPQYLERLKSGRYGFDNCLAYLVHAKDESKYQYRPEEVVTVLGENYEAIYQQQIETWVRGRATKNARETDLSVDWLVEKILSGEVTKRNIMLTDKYYAIYGQHKNKINEAFATIGERKSYQTVADLEAGLFKKTILFIHGDSGAGKTKYSKELIALLQKISQKHGQTWDFCSTASTNAFDDYNGEEILFLDDIRSDNITVADLLKLLDPYMISPVSARYHNKMGSPKVIIITNTKTPFDFFKQAKGNVNEDFGQFVRRFDYLVQIDKEFYFYIPKKMDRYSRYSFIFSQTAHYPINYATDKIVKNVIRNMQWNHQKKVINANDQINKDNPNTQQK